MFGISWLTGKLIAGLGSVLLVVAVVGWLYGSGKHAGKLAQANRDAPVIRTWKVATYRNAQAGYLWEQAYWRLDQSLLHLKAVQDAKLASADKAVQHAARNRPHVAAKVKALSGAIHPELNGVTLEAWNKADADVVEALR